MDEHRALSKDCVHEALSKLVNQKEILPEANRDITQYYSVKQLDIRHSQQLVLVRSTITDLGICQIWQQALVVKAHLPDEHASVSHRYLPASRAQNNSPHRLPARQILPLN